MTDALSRRSPQTVDLPIGKEGEVADYPVGLSPVTTGTAELPLSGKGYKFTPFTKNISASQRMAEYRWLQKVEDDRFAYATDMKMLGKLIALRRRDLSLRQSDLATKAGVGFRLVSEIENGKSTAQFGKVMRLCQVLGIYIRAAL
ncbi:hypothetical protein CG471_22820 [Sphingobium sp. IP1]|uniref:helix-turn-helix domain-containing protein n=1 Tax=Sphingobium sp. IP1 TaxID=2021637 RepID=UPI000C087C4F|nr:helix-turn-helix domain-containing protein [Sphingobium sp. IP1]PHP17452.1 hypothetical protein CG471_22820 [Sphingobium sp. IP1]